MATDDTLGFLDGIWDRTLGVFDRVVDLELAGKEFKLAADLFSFKKAQAKAARKQKRRLRDEPAKTTDLPRFSLGGINPEVLLLLGLAGVAGFLLIRK